MAETIGVDYLELCNQLQQASQATQNVNPTDLNMDTCTFELDRIIAFYEDLNDLTERFKVILETDYSRMLTNAACWVERDGEWVFSW